MNISTNKPMPVLTKRERATLETARKICGQLAGAFDILGKPPAVPQRAEVMLADVMLILDGAARPDEVPPY